MAAPTNKLMQIVQETQGQLPEYLKRADERQERQSRATLKALAEIQQGQKDIAQLVANSSTLLLGEIQQGRKEIAQLVANSTKTLATMRLESQALTAKTLELTRDIHTRTTSGSSSSH